MDPQAEFHPDRRELERLRLSGAEDRREQQEAVRRFASQVAHDLNNLLAPLAAYPDLIKMRLPEDHPAVQYCDALEEAVEQLSAFNESLLAFGRRVLEDPEPVDLNELVRQTVAEMPAPPPALQVRLELAPDLRELRGTPARLMRVVANLLSNAREAMQEAGVVTVATGNVELAQSSGSYERIPAGAYVRLEVADTGPGIAPDLRERIFDPFFTTRITARGRRPGLGLNIVQAIVGDHGGYLDLENREGQGAIFSVYLPVVHG